MQNLVNFVPGAREEEIAVLPPPGIEHRAARPGRQPLHTPQDPARDLADHGAAGRIRQGDDLEQDPIEAGDFDQRRAVAQLSARADGKSSAGC